MRIPNLSKAQSIGHACSHHRTDFMMLHPSNANTSPCCCCCCRCLLSAIISIRTRNCYKRPPPHKPLGQPLLTTRVGCMMQRESCHLRLLPPTKLRAITRYAQESEVLHFFIVFGNRSPHRAVNTGRTTAADCGTQKGAEAVGVVKRTHARGRSRPRQHVKNPQER